MNNNYNIEMTVKTDFEEQKIKFVGLMQHNTKNFLEIGKLLNQFKKENKDLYNEALSWSKEYSYSRPTLSKFAKISDCLKGEENEKLAIKLGVKKSYLLTKIKNDDDRKEFINKNIIVKYDDSGVYKIKNITVKELDNKINEFLGINKDEEEELSYKKEIVSMDDYFKDLIKKIDKEILLLQSLNPYYSDNPLQKDVEHKLRDLNSFLYKVSSSDEDDDFEDGYYDDDSYH